MAGLVFNGLRLLDLAAEQDPRTEVRGDVTLLTGIRDRLHEPYQRMQQVKKKMINWLNPKMMNIIKHFIYLAG